MVQQVFDAVVSNVAVDYTMNFLRSIGIFKAKTITTAAPCAQTLIQDTPLWKLARDAGPYVQLAGVLGASAVVIGAYGAHRAYPTDSKTDLQKIFETANRFHFFHSLALLAVPLARRPAVTGTFFVVGMTLFCGTCYYRAFTEDRTYQRLAPIGGTCLIIVRRRKKNKKVRDIKIDFQESKSSKIDAYILQSPKAPGIQ